MWDRSRDRSSSDDQQLRTALIIEWWQMLDDDGDYGSANWEVLVMHRDRVTACLALDPPDLDEAESWTAQAVMLVTGQAAL